MRAAFAIVDAGMRSLGLALALLALGCSSPTDPGPFREGTVVLQLGRSTEAGSDLRISFAQVVEDSRCPASVACIWQGNGAIRLDITTGAGSQSLRLNTAGGPSYPQEVTAGGYTFKLVELQPAPQTPDPIPPQQYRATIRVTRVQ